jgi:hypothetical protein
MKRISLRNRFSEHLPEKQDWFEAGTQYSTVNVHGARDRGGDMSGCGASRTINGIALRPKKQGICAAV